MCFELCLAASGVQHEYCLPVDDGGPLLLSLQWMAEAPFSHLPCLPLQDLMQSGGVYGITPCVYNRMEIVEAVALAPAWQQF
jgi:hypothetical protein